MGTEIDLLKNYPRTKRDPGARGATKTEEDRAIARQFGKDFFDGDRKYGYGGYSYNPRFWQPVVPDFIEFYSLDKNSSILDIGSGKGFMLYDFLQLLPGVKVQGIDISEYAIENSLEEIREFQQVADARDLPFEDDSFDLAIAVNTLHNLERDECALGLREAQRVSKDTFITVDAYSNEQERIDMDAWNLTALTFMHVDEWKTFFKEEGYSGDYYWFIP
jgi:SAM-dependent methyltransferase|tara:strand:- start:296 stop:952 length:657 start_codon:yes stop_codon:yes gene_type:complete